MSDPAGTARRTIHEALARASLMAALVTIVVGGSGAGAVGVDDDAPRPGPPTVETLPPERGGQDVVGERLPRLHFDAWINAADDARGSKPITRGRVTLYRWWTDSCPYCEASLPAFDLLRQRYAARGLVVVAVHHPKPPRDVRAAVIRDAARKRGYFGLVAVDRDWSELERWYHLKRRGRAATSASVLVDRDGVMRFVHPGPVLYPSDDPTAARANDDFLRLDRAIRALLDEPAPAPPDGAEAAEGAPSP